MSAAMPYLRGERSGKVMVVTLDDGYLDNLQAALPVLQAHGFSATCYLVTVASLASTRGMRNGSKCANR